jgi:NADPH:quinone reductase-like Zn-dependent oxidoreductase
VSERQNMRAVGFTEFGGPEVLGIVTLPVLSPGPGQVRVRVTAAAVNPTDLAFRAGAHRSVPAGMQPPYVPGMDLAGVIEEIGPRAAAALPMNALTVWILAF